MSDQTSRNRVVLVTGPSGAGRGTALDVLEDLGFEAIDNIPLRMVPRLFDGKPLAHPLALGIDARNRDFSPERLLDLHSDLMRETNDNTSLLFLDCQPDVLLRRYSETRRRHPLAKDDPPEMGVARESALLRPVEARADILIDTTHLTPHDLKAELHKWFADSTIENLSVAVQSFSYKRGIPHGADMVFDCRFLNNPHWDQTLRDKTGLDEEVQRYLEKDARLGGYRARITDMMVYLLPQMKAEGKTHLSIGIGCTGGQHRSVVVAELVARDLADKGWRVSIGHKELARRGIVTTGSMVLPDPEGVAQ